MALGDSKVCKCIQECEIRSMSKKENAISDSVSIDLKLIEEGTAQLTSEIEVLEAWLNELDSSEGSDNEIVAARKSYNDMLRSRKEMRTTLTKQAKLQF
jgi:hypothetical protein